MQAEIARESERFDMEAVCKDINEKLIRRHPHVFKRDENSAKNSDQVLKRWEEIKATEKKNGPQANKASPFQTPASSFAIPLVCEKDLQANTKSPAGKQRSSSPSKNQ